MCFAVGCLLPSAILRDPRRSYSQGTEAERRFPAGSSGEAKRCDYDEEIGRHRAPGTQRLRSVESGSQPESERHTASRLTT